MQWFVDNNPSIRSLYMVSIDSLIDWQGGDPVRDLYAELFGEPAPGKEQNLISLFERLIRKSFTKKLPRHSFESNLEIHVLRDTDLQEAQQQLRKPAPLRVPHPP